MFREQKGISLKWVILSMIAGIIIGMLAVWVVFARANSVTVGARVPMTKDNCWSTYKAYQDCFDECTK